MSSGSEFHKSQFILWGRVIDFFFIVCFSFFFPPSCQASSTWIELFDLRAAVQKEEETPLPSFNTSPPWSARLPPFSCKCHPPSRGSGNSREGVGPGQGFPRWSGASIRALTHPFSACTHTPGQFDTCLCHFLITFFCVIHLLEALQGLPVVPATHPPSMA